MKLVDAFIGPVQSKYAAVAILIAVVFVCLTVLFSKNKIPFSQKLAIAFILFLTAIPTMLYVLFQVSCIVTGSGEETWWCNVYSWVLVAFIIIYAIIVVILAIMSLNAGTSMEQTEAFYNNKHRYERFASSMVAEEKEKAKHPSDGLLSTAPIGLPMAMPIPLESVPYKAVSEGVISPTIEKFTSCGTELPKTQ